MPLDLDQRKLFGLEYWVKHWYRYGLCFDRYSRLLQQTAAFSPQALQAFQNQHLKRMVGAAYRDIPYYRDLFSDLKLKPEAIQTAADLTKLPYLTKELVVANFDKLVSVKKRNFLCKVAKTSGTTGSPAQFIRSFNSINFENAAVWRQWKTGGDQGGKRRITLRGEVVVPMSQSKPPFWRFNPANQELLMCGFHLNENTFEAYLQKIMAFQPQILSSYPSNAYALAKYFRQHKISYRFDAVFTSSETLSPGVRQFIEETFQTRVYDWYGQAERVAAIGHCPKGTYHIQEDYSLVELSPMGQNFEIVGTHLFNEVMPLIRYKTGDLVKANPEQSCDCGSHFRTVASIDGRSCDYILTPEGYRISAANHIFHGVENVLEGQLYQDNRDCLIIKVVAASGFTEHDRAELIRNARENTSERMKIVVEEVDHIRRAPNGKFQSIVSRLPLDHNGPPETLASPA
ncbi:phenylacetate--CoA ligase family protein [Vampirovibrio sp.]|uniref:phenylacetate--CoA ligase family protein n=1 Tax=Vampirovibrio sp. TaxID=2717857 RepID=UPI0035936EB3